MNLFSQTDMLELLEVCKDDLAASCEQFEASAPFVCRRKGELLEAVSSGHISVKRVAQAGITQFLIFYHCNKRCLFVNGMQVINKGHSNDMAFEACEELARDENCIDIRFMTKLKGLARLATAHGYTCEMVVFAKSLS